MLGWLWFSEACPLSLGYLFWVVCVSRHQGGGGFGGACIGVAVCWFFLVVLLGWWWWNVGIIQDFLCGGFVSTGNPTDGCSGVGCCGYGFLILGEG